MRNKKVINKYTKNKTKRVNRIFKTIPHHMIVLCIIVKWSISNFQKFPTKLRLLFYRASNSPFFFTDQIYKKRLKKNSCSVGRKNCLLPSLVLRWTTVPAPVVALAVSSLASSILQCSCAAIQAKTDRKVEQKKKHSKVSNMVKTSEFASMQHYSKKKKQVALTKFITRKINNTEPHYQSRSKLYKEQSTNKWQVADPHWRLFRTS